MLEIFELITLHALEGDLLTQIMLGAVALFALLFLCAFKSSRCATAFKFAPSVMTALGLLGTFGELTHSLSSLDINTLEGIGGFVKELKGVFFYSILGISTAVLFMVGNLIVSAVRSKKALLTNIDEKRLKMMTLILKI